MFNHPFSIIAGTLEGAVAAANDFISESTAAGFEGIPANSYAVTPCAGIYGTSYLVAFNKAA